MARQQQRANDVVHSAANNTSASFEFEQGHTRKRQKVTRACDACKARKKRCTGDRPCAPCLKVKASCTYEAQYSRGVAVPPSPSPSRSAGAQQLDHISPAHISPVAAAHNSPVLQDLERNIVTRPGARRRESALSGPRTIHATEHSANHILGTTSGTAEELIAQTEPHIYSEVPSRRLTPEPGEAIDGQYHGPSSHQAFLGQALKRFRRDHNQNLLQSQQHQQNPTDNATLSFGDAKIAEPDLSRFIWPEHRMALGLLHRYFEFASPTYRYMHEPTVAQWLSMVYANEDVPIAAQALILLLFASASVFTVDSLGDTVDASHQGWQSSEVYFAKAERLLAEEKGPPRLESVQARFAAVQYLLASSRPNKGLFRFGTMIQLMQAVGIHRRRIERAGIVPLDSIAVEMHRRLFWCAFTLDKYLSIIMGRMPLLHLDHTNQALPSAANDEDITAEGMRPPNPMLGRDCLLHATVAHAEIGIILAKASQEQHLLPSKTDHTHVEAAVRRSEEIREWHSKLTPILSGAIHSSSLIPCFRRQHSVLTLARLHAIMFITRPLLLRDLSTDLPQEQSMQYREQLHSCIRAAKDAVEMINGSARYKVLYPAFWFSQYIAFNAISIIHIYIIQLSRHRIPEDLFTGDPQMDCKSLLQLALEGQGHLAEAGVRSAPVWRYSPILEGLSSETARYVTSQVVRNRERVPSAVQAAQTTAIEDVPGHAMAVTGHAAAISRDAVQESNDAPDHFAIPSFGMDELWANGHESLFDGLIAENMDNNLTMDFWPQFDNLPIGFGFQ